MATKTPPRRTETARGNSRLAFARPELSVRIDIGKSAEAAATECFRLGGTHFIARLDRAIQ
jgi:hypothetical protein